MEEADDVVLGTHDARIRTNRFCAPSYHSRIVEVAPRRKTIVHLGQQPTNFLWKPSQEY
jgi:hypothetical protein